jgi:PAS domain S-box-containing protein
MKILVVDDTGINRRLLRALLEDQQMTVHEARDGAEALELLGRELVDLVITDILMPRMDGYRFCYEVRRTRRLMDLPVLVYSATYTSMADEKLALDIGADMFLRKPSPSSAILAAVRELTSAPRPPRQVLNEIAGEMLVMREYSEQLVIKLSEKNEELARQSELLAQSEEQYRLLFQHSMDAILQINTEGQLLRANEAACAMFGLDEAALIALPPLAMIDARDGRLNALRETMAHKGRASGVIPALRQDGSGFECEASAVRYAAGDGVIRTIVVLRDLTGQLQAQRTQRALEARLSEASKMESIGQMAAGLAHDFNNIISAILGNVALAGFDPDNLQTLRLSLTEVGKAGVLARNMVRHLLAFAREQPHERLPIPLGPVLQEQAGLLRASMPPQVKLQVQIDDSPVLVRADATQIGEVVMNLCTNAWQALGARDGQITLSLHSGALPDDVEWLTERDRTGRFACLQVTDDGPGMDALTRARMFEPFFTTKARGEGTGLGLSMVLGIVRTHEGVVSVDSAPGQGSRISVYLPVAADSDLAVLAEAAAVDPTPMPALPPHGEGKHLAYLDDYDGLVFLVERAMKTFGFQVSGFEHAEQLIEAVRAEPGRFDVVITDYNMPGPSGIDVTRMLKALRPDLPVLITSGFVSEQLQQDAREAGAAEVIYKTNTIEEMCSSIRRAIATL